MVKEVFTKIRGKTMLRFSSVIQLETEIYKDLKLIKIRFHGNCNIRIVECTNFRSL